MCSQVVFEFSNREFCSLQVASRPGDWKCVLKLSSNSLTLNFVRSKSPVNDEIESANYFCFTSQSVSASSCQQSVSLDFFV